MTVLFPPDFVAVRLVIRKNSSSHHDFEFTNTLYLNVSRLQNAADAAALAGAQALVKKNNAFDNYYVVQLASNRLPADFDTYSKVFDNTFDNSTIATGILLNYKNTKDETLKKTFAESQVLAEQYARKNLEDDGEVTNLTDLSKAEWITFSATDAWNKSVKKEDRKVTGTIDLKYQIVDGKNDVYGPLYYVVSLHEKIRHFLLPGWFEAMDAPVRAVVLLQPHHKGLITPMQYFERTEIIDNWEYAKKYKGTTGFYSGKWNHYMAGTTSDDTGIAYTADNPYRTESIGVKPVGRTGYIGNDDYNGSDGQTTAANGGKFYAETEVDSINIDFQAEVRKKFSTDWDLGYPLSDYSYSHVEKINGEYTWGIGNGDDKRILFNVEFNQPFLTRDTEKKNKSDPLWTRIESDPLKNPYDGAGVSVFNSVRQITLNFNSDNSTVSETADGKKYYKYRPYVIFYTGPENIDYTTDENRVLIRHSQPVVLNLNEDTNAILYFPNSPVIINGNNKKLTGFVIAKCFLHSVTEEDMTSNTTIKLYDGFNAMKDFTGDFVMGRDSEEQTVFFHEDDLLTKEEIAALHGENATITTAPTTGNLVVTDVIDAPEYPVLSFTKDLYTYCTTLEEYFAKTAEYINSTYTKAKYMQATKLSEDKVSMIKFPEENEVLRNDSGIIANPNTEKRKYGNFTAIEIPVATADLLNEDPDPDALTKDNKYVKVLKKVVDEDGKETFEEKYIAKSKLPHMRVKWNSNFPYVCIYDLKTGLGWNMEPPFLCVKPMDDTTSTADSAIVFTNSKVKADGGNQWGDVWVIEYQLLDKNYDVNYKADKLEFVDENGMKFFMLKADIKTEPEVVGKYKKIVMLDAEGKVLKDAEGKEVVKYLREDSDVKYYTKVDNNKTHPYTNYIIVDKNGNMLTKPVTSPDIFGKTTVAENTALSLQAATIGNETLKNYWNDYTRAPNSQEQWRDPGDSTSGYYRKSDEREKNRDYAIPALERIYKKDECFNLSDESMYSYFFIDELWRVNYHYLNVDEFEHKVNGDDSDEWKVDDMFFTTTRAEWID